MHLWTATDDATLAAIADVFARGGVVLLPTDTIYGLHASASNDDAVQRIAAMKGRPGEKPFITLAASIADVTELGCGVPDVLNDIWPAPMTAILRCGDGTRAVRIPAVDWLRRLLAKSGPLVSTSANRSGEPPVSSPEQLARDLHLALDGLLDLGPRAGEPSAIVDFTGPEPRVTREGDLRFTQNLRKTLRISL
jgi:tRNA threonylcarbamoyl adenosine modification protein (Sua5/YciO/YrdC/YwlC family)